MIGPSKILTVSYGTFSCTLEGFDDPFNTMKAIAEYFRDLAAGDRYFGAEPPIPDAAMLHKIAEREIHRRVEAKIQENGVILRTGDALSPAAQIAAPPYAAPRPSVPDGAAAALPLAATADAAPAPSVAAEAPAGFETAAQRLSRLRAAQLVEPVRAPVSIATIETYSEDQDVEAAAPPIFFTDAAPIQPAIPETSGLPADDDADAPLPAEAVADTDLSDLRALDGEVAEYPDTAAQIDVVDHSETAVLIALADQDDAMLDDAARIDALGDAALDGAALEDDTASDSWLDGESLTGEVIEDPDQYPSASFDDAPADDLIDDLIEDATDADADFDAAPSADTLPDDAETDDPENDALSDTILAALARQTQLPDAPAEALDNLEDDRFDASGSIAASIAAAADAEEMDGASDLAESDLAESDLETAGPEAEPPQVPVALDDAAAADTAAPQAAETGALARTETGPAPELPAPELPAPELPASALVEKLQRARARVIKIRRAGAPSVVIGRGSAAAVAPPVEAFALPADALSPHAEAALHRELGALEPELGAQAQAALTAALDAAPAPPQAAPPQPNLTQPALPSAPQPTAMAGVDAVDRLVAQTNSQLEVPETRRRQSAIAHLKAAVAATIADRLTNPRAAAQHAQARLDPYRKDLEQVVGPTRPGDLPAGDRPAPLVLVSSQRIDRPKPAADAPNPRVVQPVRPRRVTSGGPTLRPVSLVGDDEEDEIAEDAAANIFDATAAQSFPEFAERLGVSTMPDMLEAAAAYCALVLGREQFSRPLLLETVARLPGAEDTSLEESLRGFGTLLRDGRITKVRRGQFQLAEDSHVLTEARRFAG